MTCKKRLSDLRKGRIFWLDGQRGKLLYCNECRAHVQLADKEVVIKGQKFKRSVFDDWAPTTIVDVTVTFSKAFEEL